MFIDFVQKQLKVELFPGQRVLSLVSFDGVSPCQLDGADRELARELFGDVETIPQQARRLVAWEKGARLGGTMLCAYDAIYLGLRCPLETGDGELAFNVCVAPDMKTGHQWYRYITGKFESIRSLKRLVQGEIGKDSFIIRRPDGKLVCFEVLAASAGGASLRGRSYITLTLDESAFFKDIDTGVVNDMALHQAGGPRVVAGGQEMIISTVWARRGLLHDLVDRNFGNCTTCIAAIAKTLTVRPTEQNKAIYAEMLETDADNARREFDCEAFDVGTSDFMEAEAIRQCTDDALPLVTLPTEGDLAASGIDTGFRRDPSALVIVHRNEGKPLLVAECIERKPEHQGASPKIVLGEFRPRLTAHGVKTIGCDQHYVQTVRDELSDFEVKECPPSNEFKLASYTYVRDLLRSGGVIIPGGNRRLINQLRDVQCTPLAGGGMRIFSPRKMGQHGDVASAFVLAAWTARSAIMVDYRNNVHPHYIHPESVLRQRYVDPWNVASGDIEVTADGIGLYRSALEM